QMDRAVALTRRTGHHGDTRAQRIIPDELEVGMPASEEPREFLLEAGVDLLERLVEPRPGLLVDAAHRVLERRKSIREVLELPIEVLLALAVLRELVDRREIDLAELPDRGASLGEPLLPGERIGIGGESLLDLLEREPRRRELLRERLAAHSNLLRAQACLLHGRARLEHALLGAHALLIEHAQLRVGPLELAPGGRKLALHVQPACEQLLETPFELANGSVTACELALELGAALLELCALLDHAFERDGHRALARAARLAADQQTPRGELRGLRVRASTRNRLAALLALAFEVRAPRIEVREKRASTLVRAVRPSERLFSRIHFAGGRGGLLIEALPPQHRLLSTRPGRLELPEQIGMLAVRVVDVRLHTVASALG